MNPRSVESTSATQENLDCQEGPDAQSTEGRQQENVSGQNGKKMYIMTFNTFVLFMLLFTWLN